MDTVQGTDMSQEIFRMASFGQNTPKPVTSFEDNVNIPRFPSYFALSKAGFYRHQNSDGDEVRCFSCGLILKDWSSYYGNSPISVHLCKSPNCPYLNCQNSDVLDTPNREGTPLSTVSGSPHSPDMFLTAAESVTVRRQLFPEDENINRNNGSILTILTNGQIQASIKLPFKPRFGDTSTLFESKRYRTFVENPCVKAKGLAASGFIIRSRGKIFCVFCGKQTDCPTADCSLSASAIHHSLNPNCPFTRGFDLGNVSCDLENLINGDTNDSNGDNSSHNDSGSDNVLQQSDLFYNPYFEDFTVREESFREWPPQMKPTSQQLCEAGFFYTGTFDKVTCFACGCSLSKWQVDADALVQHAKHSPSCMFLHKHPQYHDVKQLAMEAQELTSCEMPAKDGPVTNDSPVKTPFPFKPTVDPTIITNCQAALTNSYPNYDLLVGWMLTTRKEFQMIQEMRGNIQVQEITLENKDQQIQHKDQQIDQHRQQIDQHRQQIQQHRQQIQHKDQQIQHKDQQIDQHRQQIQHKDQQCMQQVSDIEQYRDELSSKDGEILQLHQQFHREKQLLNTQLDSKNQLVQAQTERIDQLEQDNIRMQNMIMQLRRELQVSTSRRG